MSNPELLIRPSVDDDLAAFTVLVQRGLGAGATRPASLASAAQ